MKNKLVVIFILALAASVAVLLLQNIKLQKKLLEVSSEKANTETLTSPKLPETKPANPAGASPFDKPNVDPAANQFPANAAEATQKLTTIKFDRLTHDFGRINEGKKVRTKFTFTNTGNVGLIISHAQGSCGCTVPTWPQQPVKPGESGEIDVEFDSNGKHGETEKTVTVVANTNPPSTILTIKSTVIPRDK